MANKRGIIWRVLRSSPMMRISLYFLAFAALILFYTNIIHHFYPILEGKPISWSSALFFVVESMTTVGYGDLLPFTNPTTMYLSIIVIFSGVIMIFIVVPLLLAPYFAALLAPTPPRGTPHALSGHVIIVGYGELARSFIESLMISDLEIVIVEQDEALALEVARRYRKQAYVIWGEYGNTATWVQAWVSAASHIVVCEEERTAANIILGLREHTKAKIIAVVDKLSFDRYIRYAGAEYVLSPKHTTGRILARHAILNPHSDMIFEIPGLDRQSINIRDVHARDLRLINIPIMSGCRAAGKRLQEIGLFEFYGISPLFLWRAGHFTKHLSGREILDDTTTLFLIGRADALADAVEKEFIAYRKGEATAVIAGFGDVGAAAYHELVTSGVNCMVVDRRQQAAKGEVGDAQDESVLTRAGVGEAQFCIVALNDDNVNIFTTLMARNLNPTTRILARANEPASVDKLYRAGADYVALLPTIGGQTLARIVLSDTVTVILDLPNGDKAIMKRMRHRSPTTVGRIERATGVLVIGIEDGVRQIVSPAQDDPVAEGEAVIVVGGIEHLKRFIHFS